MAKQGSAPPQSEGQTVASIIGNFTVEEINSIKDSAVQEAALDCLNLAMGIATVFLEPENPNQQAIASQLRSRNIGPDDAKQLVADGETLVAIYKDKVAKESAWRAAGTKTDAATKHVHDTVQGHSNMIRGVLGNQSSSLAMFGVKMLGGRGTGRRKPASADKKDGKGGTDNTSGGAPKA